MLCVAGEVDRVFRSDMAVAVEVAGSVATLLMLLVLGRRNSRPEDAATAWEWTLPGLDGVLRGIVAEVVVGERRACAGSRRGCADDAGVAAPE